MPSRSLFVPTVFFVAAATANLLPAFAVDSPAPPATATAPRARVDVEAELTGTMKQLEVAFPSLVMVGDVEMRTPLAAKAIPLFLKASRLFAELSGSLSAPEEKAGLMAQSYQMKAIAVGLGDEATDAALKAEAPTSVPAQIAVEMGEFWRHADDAPAQVKILDAVATTAAANPANEDLADALFNMFHSGAANYAVKQRIIEIVRKHLTGDTAKQLVADGDSLAKLKAFEGQPAAVAGRTITGGSFDSATLKGKVILVDFWATWCVPCRALIPGTRALYQEMQPKGFEVIGVDCDDSDAPVVAFTRDNNMPWTQLRDTSQNADDYWHPLTKKWDIKVLPAVFLIDKKGILRDVEGDDHTAAKVRKLLAE